MSAAYIDSSGGRDKRVVVAALGFIRQASIYPLLHPPDLEVREYRRIGTARIEHRMEIRSSDSLLRH